MGIARCFFWWEKFLKGFDTGQSDIRSGTSMTTWCVVNAIILYTLIQLDSSKHRSWSGAISRLSKGRKIHVSWRIWRFIVNLCVVLWCGRDLWVETANSNLPCFTLCGKTTPNKQRAAKPYKIAMNWAQVTPKKQQQTQVYVSKIYSINIYAYLSMFWQLYWISHTTSLNRS